MACGARGGGVSIIVLVLTKCQIGIGSKQHTAPTEKVAVSFWTASVGPTAAASEPLVAGAPAEVRQVATITAPQAMS